MRVNRLALLKVLDQTKPGLASREIIDQSSSFVFSEGKVITYNDEVSVSAPLEGLDLSCAIPAEKLHGLLAKMEEEEIELKQKEEKLYVRAGKMKACISVDPDIRLPLEEIEKEDGWELIPERLLEGMEHCADVCSIDLSKPVLTCVFLRKDSKAVGSDGFRIVRYDVGGVIPHTKEQDGILVPAPAVKELTKYKSSGMKYMAVSDGWMHLRNEEGLQFSCRTFAGTYPEVDPFLDTDGKKLRLPKKMQSALQRARIFSKNESTQEENATINLEPGQVTVKARDEHGWYEEKLLAKYEGEYISFRVHPAFLAEALSSSKKCILGENRIKFQGKFWEYVTSLDKIEEEED